jgi:hypothetical protein
MVGCYTRKRTFHLIRLCTPPSKALGEPKPRTDHDFLWVYLDTLLHELHHAQQQEKLGAAFESTYWHKACQGTAQFVYFYSPIECEARAYSTARVGKALLYYLEIDSRSKHQ